MKKKFLLAILSALCILSSATIHATPPKKPCILTPLKVGEVESYLNDPVDVYLNDDLFHKTNTLPLSYDDITKYSPCLKRYIVYKDKYTYRPKEFSGFDIINKSPLKKPFIKINQVIYTPGTFTTTELITAICRHDSSDIFIYRNDGHDTDFNVIIYNPQHTKNMKFYVKLGCLTYQTYSDGHSNFYLSNEIDEYNMIIKHLPKTDKFIIPPLITEYDIDKIPKITFATPKAPKNMYLGSYKGKIELLQIKKNVYKEPSYKRILKPMESFFTGIE